MNRPTRWMLRLLQILVLVPAVACGGSGSSGTTAAAPDPSAAPSRVQGLQPAYAYAGRTTTATEVLVTGVGFSTRSQVRVKGVSRATTLVDDSTLKVTLTVEELATPGTLSLVVDTGGVETAAVVFRVLDLDFGGTAVATPDWTAATHGKLKAAEIAANLATVFDGSTVQRMDIRIAPAHWSVMQSDLQVLRGTIQRGPTGMPDYSVVADPAYVPCTVTYGGRDWYKVGIRFKGNSSLYQAASQKLPFKLKFNEFETVHPAIANQRFFGFKSLSLKNNYRDPSEVHEVAASRLFRDFGLKAAHASFYRLYVDTGAGPVYHGLHTLVEEVDDTVLKTQYASDGGNLYKPEGRAAMFSPGSFNAFEYGKKNNEGQADYSDVRQLLEAVNSPLRSSDRAAWKAGLEALFDVPVFLRWLAANTVMQNWDSYGVSPQNYLLYRNPATGRFEWIPWDANEALTADPKCISLAATEVSSEWPLLRLVLDDPAYAAQYRQLVGAFAAGPLSAPALEASLDGLQQQIATAVAAESLPYSFTSTLQFAQAMDGLKLHVQARRAAAAAFAAAP